MCATQLTQANTSSDLEVAALNSLITPNSLLSTALAGLGQTGFTTGNVATLLNNVLVQQALSATGLYPLTTNAGAIATCATATIPVGNYTGLQLALTGAHPSAIT